MLRSRCLVILTSVLPAVAGAQAPVDSLDERVARVEQGLRLPVTVKGEVGGAMSLEERMRFYRVPGVSVAVIHRGAIDWARGYGLVGTGHATAVTTETLFQAASISKSVTALAVLRLVEQGLLDLDGDVNLRLRTWRVPANEFTAGDRVTLRRLLSHSAGISDWAIGGGWPAGQSRPALAQLLEGQAPGVSATGPVPARVVIPIGTRWRYSNFGYAIIQQLIEDVVAVPFARHLEAAVLTPLGLGRSTFDQPLPEGRWAEAAVAHDREGRPIGGRWRVYPAAAPSGLWTTPTELARVALAIQRAAAGQTGGILSEPMARLMVTRQVENTGLGVNLRGSGPTLSFFHGGSNAGFRAFLVAFVERGDGAVVMTNGAQGDELINEILRGIARTYGWPENGTAQFTSREVAVVPADSTLYPRYAGRYEFERFPGTFLAITLSGGSLWGQIGNNPARFELLPQSDQGFVMRNGWNLTFVPGPDGLASEVRLDNGRAIRAR